MNHTTPAQTAPAQTTPFAADAASISTFVSMPGHAELNGLFDGSAVDTSIASVTEPADRQTQPIEFRVLREGAPVRRLRLTGNRYTFGSADGCSIRLSDKSLRPMHAVLIRDADRILLRAYSVPVEVNGIRVTEVTLQVGDVLALGAYQFELIVTSPPSVPTYRPTGFADQAAVGSSLNPSHHPASSAAKELSELDHNVWRERLRREADQWRDRQAECDRRESSCDNRESSLRGRETELWERAEQLQQRETHLRSQQETAIESHQNHSSTQHELTRLREETQAKQRDHDRRESEILALQNKFQQQEERYLEQAGDASQQLRLSQEQAESASHAAQRMREQLESLNQQIGELSAQQETIHSKNESQRQQQQRLQLELEAAHDQAINAKDESSQRCQQAETRVEEMAAQIDALKFEQDLGLEAHKAKLDESVARVEESETLAQLLHEQLDDLQITVTEAQAESTQLRAACDAERETVRDLEALASEQREDRTQEHDRWTAETEQLRQQVEQLAADLARTDRELGDLREANESLSEKLSVMRQQRDEARTDADSRPTSVMLQSLQIELDAANDRYDELKQERAEAPTPPAEPAENQTTDNAVSEWNIDFIDARGPDSPDSDAPDSDDSVSDDPASSRPVSGALVLNSPHSEDQVCEDVASEMQDAELNGTSPLGATDGFESPVDDPQLSSPIWNSASFSNPSLEDPALEDPALDEQRVVGEPSTDEPLGDEPRFGQSWSANPSTNDQGTTASFGSDSDRSSGESPWTASVPYDESDMNQPPSGISHIDDGDDRLMDDESSSMLSQDIFSDPSDEGSDPSDEGSDPSEVRSDLSEGGEEDGTFLMSQSAVDSWDDEHPEEALASSWTNESDGFRTESFDADNGLNEDAEAIGGAEAIGESGVAEASQDEESDVSPVADDDSIEAYMNRLLQRVQGQSDSDTSQPETVSLSSSTSSPELSDSGLFSTDADDPQSALSQAAIDPDTPLVPRSEAPEKHSDLSAMRALANESARNAISRSARVQSRDIQIKGFTKFTFAGVALVCGAACLVFIPGVIRYLAVAMTVVVACVCIREGLQFFAEAKRRLAATTPGEPDTDPGDDEPSDELDGSGI